MAAQTFQTAGANSTSGLFVSRAGALAAWNDANADSNAMFDDTAIMPAPTARKIKVPQQEIADMTAQLAIMIKSGLDLSSALSSLAAQCERPALASVLQDVNELVRSGNTLSESLRLYPELFNDAYVATIAAAEASGRMAEVLNQLANMQRSELRLKQSIKGLLTYPVLLTFISGSVISILIVFVLPRFADIFAQYELSLPVLTRMLLAVSTELKSRWWIWFPLTFAGIAGTIAWRATDQGRRAIDRFLLTAPTVRQVARPLLIGRSCSLLGMLLHSGVPLLDGLRLCRQAASNTAYRDMLGDVADSVLNGHGMGPVLLEADIVPISAREMLVTAESTGKLEEVARLLGQFYEDEAENRMKQAVRVLEPMITVGMGLIVAVVVLSVMLPIFDLSTMSK